jgi:hypothetical protein
LNAYRLDSFWLCTVHEFNEDGVGSWDLPARVDPIRNVVHKGSEQDEAGNKAVEVKDVD